MSLSEEEKKRLQNFQKITQGTKRVNSLDLTKEKKYLENDFSFFKKKLKEAIINEDNQEIEKNIKSLLELLSKKLALKLREQQETYTDLPEIIIEEATKKYIDECYKLLAIRNKLLQK
ncbi:MAG: hypothetical protein ACD_18C00330G0007 [uncultured bacterium]|nr:MAG: hypothetical protein ACD_18C00330G0007 [uncultured bacterium]OGH84612.1 MAG: hypothetical protein A2488_02620 [Candidatus Magasanikbacteria bacterium RIFOXYC12_FULL_32_21b]OGH91099.1 MAG: hypothetical protein A2507_03725 [Candidatus Magasanikbacteria bacterium RIFOXYD12_FULL_33_17]HAO52633.1 hypothetical protein [Candidatus Magasanikbacteria bacterium]